MTTIAAIKCKNGIVMCSDSLQTGLDSKDSVSKIEPIGDDCLLGCAGYDSDYIDVFTEIVKKTFSKSSNSYYELLSKSILEFRTMYASRLEEGIFAMRSPLDNTFNIYKLKFPDILELPKENPMMIGSGGKFLELLFKIANKPLTNMKYSWDQLDIRLVAQISYLFLGQVVYHDSKSGPPISFYIINECGCRRWWDDDIFPEKKRYHMTQIVETAIATIPDLKQRIHETYLDEKIQKKFFRLLSGSSV